MTRSEVVMSNNKIKDSVKDLALEIMTEIYSFKQIIDRSNHDWRESNKSIDKELKELKQSHLNINIDKITKRLTKCEKEVGNYLNN